MTCDYESPACLSDSRAFDCISSNRQVIRSYSSNSARSSVVSVPDRAFSARSFTRSQSADDSRKLKSERAASTGRLPSAGWIVRVRISTPRSAVDMELMTTPTRRKIGFNHTTRCQYLPHGTYDRLSSQGDPLPSRLRFADALFRPFVLVAVSRLYLPLPTTSSLQSSSPFPDLEHRTLDWFSQRKVSLVRKRTLHH